MTILPAGSAGQDGGPARKLINSQGCKACHALEGDGGNLAASFEEIRAKRSRAEIRRKLINPGRKHGSSRIPDFSHLSNAEVEALVSFMQPEP
ncbi:MAG: c-type cytochrome [Desulfuromonadales bacterium]|nr:c-type cytochrome [Desulfuromonadales bacterium]